MWIKYVLMKVLSPSIRRDLKRYKRQILNKIKGEVPKTSIEQMRHVLVDELGLKAGDKIIVSSGFSQLHSDGYSPQQLVELLEEIVTPEGLIMMPYYPPMNSQEWVESDNVFDMNETKSGMGVVTNVFSKMPGVVKSEHPTKAVCVWGKNASEIIKDHYKYPVPFEDGTPYGKFMKLGGTKSLCLGVGNIPIFHYFEDKLLPLDKRYYADEPYDAKLRLGNGEMITCTTLVHDIKKCTKNIKAAHYVAQFPEPIYKKAKFGYAYIYTADNDLLLDACAVEFAKGNTITRK